MRHSSRRIAAAFILLAALALPLAARPAHRAAKAPRQAPDLFTLVAGWLKDVITFDPSTTDEGRGGWDPNGATAPPDPGATDSRGGWDPNG